MVRNAGQQPTDHQVSSCLTGKIPGDFCRKQCYSRHSRKKAEYCQLKQEIAFWKMAEQPCDLALAVNQLLKQEK
jgi:hypothetical protein